jgi:uncharacterized protein (TIGR02145 family)
MKNVYLAFIAIIAFTSCSKKNDPGLNSNYITISGTNYSIVVIGSQTWTSVNYNGDGGVNYNNGANDPVNGKLYTIAEAQAVKLPNGWHLPTPADFNTLLVSIGAVYKYQINGNYYVSGDLSVKLMSKTGWTGTEGTNQSGFNAQPVGMYTGRPDNQPTPSGLATYFVVDPPSNNDLPSFSVAPSYAELEYVLYDASARRPVRFVKDN